MPDRSVPVIGVDVSVMGGRLGCFENDHEVKWSCTLSIQTMDVDTHPQSVTLNCDSRFFLQPCQWCPAARTRERGTFAGFDWYHMDSASTILGSNGSVSELLAGEVAPWSCELASDATVPWVVFAVFAAG